MNLKGRLTLASASAVAVAIALASALVFFIVRGELRRQVDEALVKLSDSFTVQTFPEDRTLPPMPPPPLGGATGYVQIVRADGLRAAPPQATTLLPASERARAVAAGSEGPFFSDVSVGGTHARVLTSPLAPGLALQVARSLEEVDQVLQRLAVVLVVITVCGIVVAGGLGRVVAHAALAPLERLTDATEHVTSTADLSRRIEAGGHGELSRLATSFNKMLEALEASLATQRRLVADASHELRTPLTSLRTNIEVLARERVREDDRRRMLADVVAQLEELTVLVSDLVELARGNEPILGVEEVRLDAVVVHALERARRRAPGTRFTADLRPSVIQGVPERIDRAVTNLLDNAVEWSPPDGAVDVGVSDGEVWVRDHGPGIDDADLPHVFDRFYRSSTARARPGSGLGLAIVRQVAEAHGGGVTAHRAEGGGALLRLRLSPTSPGHPESRPRSSAHEEGPKEVRGGR